MQCTYNFELRSRALIFFAVDIHKTQKEFNFHIHLTSKE